MCGGYQHLQTTNSPYSPSKGVSILIREINRDLAVNCSEVLVRLLVPRDTRQRHGDIADEVAMADVKRGFDLNIEGEIIGVNVAVRVGGVGRRVSEVVHD